VRAKVRWTISTSVSCRSRGGEGRSIPAPAAATPCGRPRLTRGRLSAAFCRHLAFQSIIGLRTGSGFGFNWSPQPRPSGTPAILATGRAGALKARRFERDIRAGHLGHLGHRYRPGFRASPLTPLCLSDGIARRRRVDRRAAGRFYPRVRSSWSDGVAAGADLTITTPRAKRVYPQIHVVVRSGRRDNAARLWRAR
jgi:hypothetical protein